MKEHMIQIQAKSRLSASNEDYKKLLPIGIAAMEKLRPNGRVKPGRAVSDMYECAYFTYEFEAEGLKIEAEMEIAVGHLMGKSKPPAFHFGYRYFGIPGQKMKAFNPEADNGPFITADDDAETKLAREVPMWEQIIAQGLKKQIDRESKHAAPGSKAPVRKPTKASSTYESGPAATQNMNVTQAGVDEDSALVVEQQLEDAESSLDQAERENDPEAVERAESLVHEMGVANERPLVGMLIANDTSDQPGLTTSDPTGCPHDESMVSADNGENDQPFDYEAWKKSARPRPAPANSGSAPKQDTVTGGADDIPDPIGDGAAFDMLIDGDPSQEEPVVQELTNNDGGTELPTDQPLLMNDLAPGTPTL